MDGLYAQVLKIPGLRPQSGMTRVFKSRYMKSGFFLKKVTQIMT